MPVYAHLSGAPSDATSPDGTASFPFNVAGSIAQGSTTAGQSGDLEQAACTTSAPTYTTGTTNPLSQTVRGSIRVEGPNASNISSGSNPSLGGVLGQTSNPAVTASNGRTMSTVGTNIGVTVVMPYSIPEATWQFAIATGGIVNTTTAVTLQAAGAAGIRNYLTRLQIATDAITVASELAIRDGAAGTVIWRGKLQAAILQQTTINFDPPLRGSAATLMEIVTLTATGASQGVYVNAQGYQAP